MGDKKSCNTFSTLRNVSNKIAYVLKMFQKNFFLIFFQLVMYSQFFFAFFIFLFGSEASSGFIPLPGNLIPNHYKIHLALNYDSFYNKSKDIRFHGKVEISFRTTNENTTSIIFHAGAHYEYEQFLLMYPNGESEKLEKGEYFEESEFYKIPLRKPLPKEESLKLTIIYANKYVDCGGRCKGFYRFPENTHSKTFIQATQGQMTGARLIFPCFDEPKYKSFFKISVSIPSSINKTGYHVLSNTPIENKLESLDEVIYEFEETPIPMSTYLVAVVVSRYENLSAVFFKSPYQDHRDTPPKKFITYGEYEHIRNYQMQKMHQISSRIIEKFTDLFKIGYAFKKLDQVIIDGFSYQGMENFGLIVYSEVLLKQSLEFAYKLITHEIAHQWFGNLVTLGDWKDMWLQESLTHYFAMYVLDELKQDNNDVEGYNFTAGFFVKETLITAMRQDSYADAAPLDRPLDLSSAESESIGFIYNKGFGVIRMLRHTYGTKVFFEAVQRYLDLYQQRNTDITQFLDCFDFVTEKYPSTISEEKPSTVFQHWYDLPGYPMINVTRVSTKSDTYDTYLLEQKRFYTFTENTPKNVSNYQWFVPITYSTSGFNNFDNTERMFWLAPNKTGIITLNHSDGDWFVINNQMTGYYLVNYDLRNWKSLIQVLNNKSTFHRIHELNRVQLLVDSFKLASSTKKYIPHDILLDLYNYLQHENKYFPWSIAFYNFKVVKITIGWPFNWSDRNKFLEVIKTVVQKKYNDYIATPNQDVSYYGQKLKKKIYEMMKEFNSTFRNNSLSENSHQTIEPEYFNKF